MHVCIQLYKIVCMHVDLAILYVSMDACMYLCIHVHMYVCIVCVCARARACMRVFIFVSYNLRCVHTYICTHACMHVGPMHYVARQV